MSNRQTIVFLAILFLVLLILGMLYMSHFRKFEGMTPLVEGTVDASGAAQKVQAHKAAGTGITTAQGKMGEKKATTST
jgi:uncharacterized protein YxeA